MVYYRNKYFIETRPLFLTDKQLVVIAYKNVVEVHNNEHVIVWKSEEENKVISLEKYFNETNKFYVALGNGDIKLYNILNFSVTEIMKLNVPIKKIFLHENSVIVVQEDGIHLYPNFDLSLKQLILKKYFRNVAFSPKTEIVAMVENKEIRLKKISGGKEMHHSMKQWSKERHFTAVACNPCNNSIATADTCGQVIIWENVLNGFNKPHIYHWHFLELNSIEYNYDGTSLLTGGNEGVFVKWNLVIKDSETNKRFFPRLESKIESIRSCYDNGSENYMVTLSDNSYRIITSIWSLINSYSNFIQRPKFLHDKIWKKTQLCPVGLISCHNMPDSFKYSIMTNGHEGKLQIFNMLKNQVSFQLDVAYQNWPTETENYLIPGFIQVKKVAVSSCGQYIATFEQLAVASKNEDNMPSFRIFHWSLEDEKFVLQSYIPLDYTDMVVDIVFHPSKNNHVICVTKSMRLILLSRCTIGEKVRWDIVHTLDLAEILHRYNTSFHHVSQFHHNAVLSTVVCPHNESDAVLVIGCNTSLSIFLWSHLLNFQSRPLVVKKMDKMLHNLSMENKSKKRLVADIVSVAIVNNQEDKNRYRLACGLFTGLLLLEMTIEYTGTVELREINVALCERNGSCIVSLSPNNSSEVAVMFRNNERLTVFNIWDNEHFVYTVVPPFVDICWTRVRGESEDKWVVAGLLKDGGEGHVVELATCEDKVQERESRDVTSMVSVVGKNLLLGKRSLEVEGDGAIQTKKMKIVDGEFLKSIKHFKSFGPTFSLSSFVS